MMRACLSFAIVILPAIVISEEVLGACNKRLYFCFLNPCQTRANTCLDPRDCRPDYCGGCKTKCVPKTTVPKRPIVSSTIRSYVPEDLIPLVEEIGADIDNYIKQPYAAEMRGIARTLNCSLGDVVLVNLIYDISAFCTSIVSQDDQGQIWHSRNLDYDFGNMLRNITVHVDFVSQGQTVYSAITYAGYIGILSGQKPKAFSITVDERYQGSVFENILLAIIDKKAVPMSFLVRDTLANEPDFESAIYHLSNTDTVSSVYFILAGVKPGEGAVITKGRLEAIDIWRLDAAHGRWFEVETNYDHWTTPPPDDDRRDPANKAMNSMGQHKINKASLFAVMSVPPVLNNHTTYTVIMSPAQPELMQAWIRN